MNSDDKLAKEMVDAVFQVEKDIWNNAIRECLKIIARTHDDYDLYLKIKKLRK